MTEEMIADDLDEMDIIEQIGEIDIPPEGFIPGEILKARTRTDGLEATVIGAAVSGHDNDLVYMNLVGELHVVRGIWATLRTTKKSERYDHVVTIKPGDVTLYPPVNGVLRMQQIILPSGLVNLVMINSNGTIFGPSEPYYIVRPGETEHDYETPPPSFFDVLNSHLDIPLQPEWAEWLWQQGIETDEYRQRYQYQSSKPILPLKSYGKCIGYSIKANGKKNEWRKIICGKLELPMK